MAGKMINKVMDFLGLEEEMEEIEEVEDENIEQEEEQIENIFNASNSKKAKGNKVVSIHTAASAKILDRKSVV